MKTQLNSYINVASDSFSLTGQLREMNEAVTHCKIHVSSAFFSWSTLELFFTCFQ